MVGGGAVNFHSYQRHSADVDFWIDRNEENLERLKKALTEIGYRITKWPEKVVTGEQNISLKLSNQSDLELELITGLNPGKTFEQAYKDALEVKGKNIRRYHVLSFDDLITSKIKAGKP